MTADRPPLRAFQSRLDKNLDGLLASANLDGYLLSIVVLPFTNLSDDREQQYFADGITEDLTTDCRGSRTCS